MLTEQKTKRLDIFDCGLCDYRNILERQHQLRDKRLQNKIPDTILIVEHPAVITLGARQNANKLLLSPAELAEKNIDLVNIRRGGGTTAHNPGQLVFYPIISLQQSKLGISEYIRKLEAIGIELLEQFDVNAERKKGFPGLWIGKKKIASIGVRVSKLITYHGMSININNDLNIFDHIIPCGLDDIEITSLFEETGKQCLMAEVKEKLTQILWNCFT